MLISLNGVIFDNLHDFNYTPDKSSNLYNKEVSHVVNHFNPIAQPSFRCLHINCKLGW